MFSGLGVAIVLLSALTVGRMTVRAVGDVEAVVPVAAVQDEDAGLDIGRAEDRYVWQDDPASGEEPSAGSWAGPERNEDPSRPRRKWASAE